MLLTSWLEKFQTLDASQRYLVAVTGIPGSGKTTFVASLIYHLNALNDHDWHNLHPNAPDRPARPRLHSNQNSHHRVSFSDPTHPDVARLLPLDGYHLTRKQLDELPNAQEAHYRRGAPFTFDPVSYIKLLTELRKPLEATTRTLYAPSFDHAVKDPVVEDIPLPPSARIVIIEGLYVALDQPPWKEALELYDELWFINVDLETATKRVAMRNFTAGLSPTYEEALKRTVENDMRNAKEILAHLPSQEKISERIESYNDDEWKSEEQKRIDEERTEAETRQMHEEEDKVRMGIERTGSIAELLEAGAGM